MAVFNCASYCGAFCERCPNAELDNYEATKISSTGIFITGTHHQNVFIATKQNFYNKIINGDSYTFSFSLQVDVLSTLL